MVMSGDATGYYVRRLRLPIVTALLVGLLLAAVPAVVRATTLCVNIGGTGGCFSAIGAAVGNASDGDTITVAPGTYHEHDITIVTSIALSGSGGPILDVGGLGSGFIIQQGAGVTISGLTVQGGHTGIVNTNGDVSLVKCLIRNNTGGGAYSAGGIANSGNLALTTTTVSGNTTTNAGGGIFNGGGSTLTMDNSAIQNNTAYEGGGVYNLGAMTMMNSSVNYNQTQGGGGGGIENRHTLTITNGSAILGNTASGTPSTSGNGGGILNSSTLIVDNSAVGDMGSAGNTAGSGSTSGSGGGIFNTSAGTVTIQNHSRVTGNTATGGRYTDGGGGIFNSPGAQTTLTGSMVSGNQVGTTASLDGTASGGGVGNFADHLTLVNTIISGNTGSSGGGIYNSQQGFTQGVAMVTNSTVSGNTGKYGGGIANDDGSLTMQGSTINGNTSRATGGGINNDGSSSPVMLTNSTLSGNVAATNGGGFFARFNAVSTLTNVTLSGNTAAGASNGLYRDSGAGPTTLKNTLVADGCTGTITSGDYNLESGTSCGFTQPHDLKKTNPLLGPLQVNAPGSTATHALPGGSPAVDRGGTSANGCPTTDQRGVSRPLGSACDIGAYELIPPRPVPPSRPGPVLGPPPPAPIPPSKPAGVPASGGPPAPIPIPRR